MIDDIFDSQTPNEVIHAFERWNERAERRRRNLNMLILCVSLAMVFGLYLVMR